MKIFLDDVRKTPDGWTRCYWPAEVIDWLATGQVTELSLDHDLGNDAIGTGFDVLKWLQETVMNDPEFPLPVKINIHSDNASVVKSMKLMVESIYRMSEEYSVYMGPEKVDE